MSLRTAIQNRIIGTLKNGNYPMVTYTSEGYSQEIANTLTPEVVCNEVEASFNGPTQSSTVYVVSDWQFEALMKFSKEVDIVDFLIENINLTFTHDSYAVVLESQSFCVLDQPATQGSHSGTQAKITFVANVKR